MMESIVLSAKSAVQTSSEGGFSKFFWYMKFHINTRNKNFTEEYSYFKQD